MIINMTPHTIDIYSNKNTLLTTIEPSGQVARVTTVDTDTGDTVEHNGISISTVRIEHVYATELPPREPGVFYVVPRVYAESDYAIDRGWADLLVPHNLLRDEQGRIIGCCALAQA